jgi:hypothetical protein
MREREKMEKMIKGMQERRDQEEAALETQAATAATAFFGKPVELNIIGLAPNTLLQSAQNHLLFAVDGYDVVFAISESAFGAIGRHPKHHKPYLIDLVTDQAEHLMTLEQVKSAWSQAEQAYQVGLEVMSQLDPQMVNRMAEIMDNNGLTTAAWALSGYWKPKEIFYSAA